MKMGKLHVQFIFSSTHSVCSMRQRAQYYYFPYFNCSTPNLQHYPTLVGISLNSLRENGIYKSQAAETSAFSALRLPAGTVSIEMNIDLLKNGEVF